MASKTKRRTPPSRRPVTTQPKRRTLSWRVIAAGVAVIAVGIAAVIGISALSGDDDGAIVFELSEQPIATSATATAAKRAFEWVGFIVRQSARL